MKRRKMLTLAFIDIAAMIAAYVFAAEGIAAFIFTIFTSVFALIAAATEYMIFKNKAGALYIALVSLILMGMFYIYYSSYKAMNERISNEEELAENISDTDIICSVRNVEEKNGKYYIIFTEVLYQNQSYGDICAITTENKEIIQGMKVIVRADIKAIKKPTNPGQFDVKNYYLAKNVYYSCSEPVVAVIEEAPCFYKVLFGIKDRIKTVIERLSPSCKGVLEAMLIGDKSELDEETTDLYSAGGISHILAISGLHISLIGSIIYFCLRKLRLGILPSSILSTVAGFLFSILTGGSVSSIRAAICLALKMSAKVVGRTIDMPSAFALSWIIVTIIYPMQIFQSGFQLSFAAMLAIAFIYPEFSELLGYARKNLKNKKHKYLLMAVNRIEDTFLGSSVISVVTAPVISWHMYYLTKASALINLLVLPLMSVLMINLIFGVFVGGMLLNVVADDILSYLFLPAEYILKLYDHICENAVNTRLRMVTGRPEEYRLLLYIAVCIILTIIVHYLNLFIEKKKNRIEIMGINWDRVYIRRKRLFRLIFILSVFIVMLMPAYLLKRDRSRGLLIFADVGQGDGVVYMDGDYCIVVDGGNSFSDGIGKKRIEPLIAYYGYDIVDGWFITHPDKDHVSGYLEIAENRMSLLRIQKVYIPKASYGEKWKAIEEAAYSKNAELIFLSKGDILMFGESELDVIYPDKSEEGDTNELSMVMKLKYNEKKVLLTGDITGERELLLIKMGADIGADILKVAHHGSVYSTGGEFLRYVGAAEAVISVGKNNYGHPGADTLERLNENRISIRRTDLEGAILYYLGEY